MNKILRLGINYSQIPGIWVIKHKLQAQRMKIKEITNFVLAFNSNSFHLPSTF